MTERGVWEVAQVDAALDAALETGAVDYEEGDVIHAADIDGEVGLGLDGDCDVDGDPDDSILEPEPATMEHSDDNIRVFVRVRPPSAREGSAPCREIVRVDTGTNTVHLLAEPARVFTFDGVLGESASQDEVFKLVGTSVGEACLNGYNGSIYVYGQTGSGKTYTMQGPVASVQSMHTNDRRGIMCRILDLIFAEVGRRHREDGNVEYRCKCSYLEIYREQITDLLEPGSTNLQVREDINRGIYVERLSEHTVWTVSDAYHVLWKGLHQRHVSATHMNDLSSRSHAVFTLILEATSTTTGGVTSTRSGRLSLIDLAGSERQTFDPHNPTPGSLPESLRMKEAGAINRSLSALTNVIMSLSRASQRRRSSVGSGNQRRPFVRYRDSKLTFLLRDSLGGNSKTVIVANCSPSALCFGETLSTLKFAARAKHIRCAAVMNEEYSGTVESLMLEVKSLKQQLTLLSSRGLIPGEVGTESQASLLAASRSKLGLEEDLEEDPLEALIAAGNGDLRRLYGPRRVRRLEILLAAALERERRCELRRHKLDKFTQYLDGLLEQKEKYFDGLRDYFTYLVESASVEACYRPELQDKLSGFRQQLCRVPTDGRGLADFYGSSTIAEDTDGVEPPQDLQQQASGLLHGRSPSYPVIGGDVMNRRRISHHLQKSPSGRLMRALNADSPNSFGSMSLLASPSAGAWFSNDMSPEEEHLECLRAENKLLRRQLENHPELHRLAVENRLLREHLASLVQQHAMAREEPPWPKGHRHARRANTGDMKGPVADKAEAKVDDAVGSCGLSREPSLTRTSRSSFLTRGESLGGEGSLMKKTEETQKNTSNLTRAPFPGIEEATQISPSDSSGESDVEDSDIADEPVAAAIGSSEAMSRGGLNAMGPTGLGTPVPPRAGGDLGSVPGTAHASSFLPTMAREVEELLHVKGGLEDSLKQFIRITRAGAEMDEPRGLGLLQRTRSGSSALLAKTEVDPKIASEILRGTTEALRVAESMMAKGKGEPLLLSASGGQDGEGAEVTTKDFCERDVFVSLMRSLPSDAPTLSRHGFASSAPHLSPMLPSGGRGSVVPTLRLSSSTGSAASRLNRTRSTKQLHCIAEQDALPPDTQEPTWLSAGMAGESDRSPMFSGEALKEAGLKVRQLCHQLELVNDAYRDMREQFKPLQEEYSRRLDDLGFLEAQCRKLDVHCRLLEERAPEGGTVSRSQLPTLSGGILSRFQRLQASAPGISGGRIVGSERYRALSDSAGSQSSYSDTLTPNGSREMLSSSINNISQSSPPSDFAVSSSSTATGNRPWAWGVGSRSHHAGVPPASVGNAATQRASSATSLRPGTTEVPPRGLLYAASVSELCLDSQRGPSSAKGQSTWRSDDYIRRVMSAPQLPVVQSSLQQVAPERSAPESQLGRSSSNPSGLGLGSNVVASVGTGVSVVPGLTSATMRGTPAAEEESTSASTNPWGGASSASGSGAVVAPSFETKTFLSLAKQPGAKTAALQYLMSSTRHALGTIGESQEGRSPSKTPGTSPTRSASVGSLGGLASLGTIGSVGAIGSVSGTQPQPPSLVQTLPHESFSSSAVGAHHHAVPNSSLYGGPASARATFRGGQLAPSGGSNTALQGGDYSKDRMHPGPASFATGPGPIQSKSPAIQAPTQSRPLGSSQQAGLSLRPAGSALPASSLVAGQRQNSLGHLNGWPGRQATL